MFCEMCKFFNINKPHNSELQQLIDPTNENFLKSITSKGIISHSSLNNATQFSTITKKVKDWYLYSLDCWLSSFYHVIWKQRNLHTIPKKYLQMVRTRKRNQRKEKSKLRPAPIKNSPSGGHFEVEQLLDERNDPETNNLQYLVHWKGYNRESDHTWENADNLRHLSKLIQKLNRDRGKESDLLSPTKRIRITTSQDHIEKFSSRLTNRINLEPDETDEYEIERIVSHAYDVESKEMMYEIHWKDYNESENTWHKETDLQNAQQLLKQYQMINHIPKNYKRRRSTTDTGPRKKKRKK